MATAATIDLSRSEQLLFLFTVDTETSLTLMREPDVERAVELGVFGGAPRGGLGIGLHMDLLERHGMRGCFFLDVLMEHQFGQAAVEATVQAVLERGHEVGLHLHTQHLRVARDRSLWPLRGALHAHEPDGFRAALEHAVNLFERRVGHPPIAYRSGGYHISEAYLAILPEFGIRIDSSLNALKNCRVPAWMRARTQPFWVGDVLEIPVTWTLRAGNPPAARALGPAPGPTQQDLTDLETGDRGAPMTAVYVSHSYQLMARSRSTDLAETRAWNAALERLPPHWDGLPYGIPPDRLMSFVELAVDEQRVATLDRTLGALAARPDVRAVTFAELAGAGDDVWRERRSPLEEPVGVWYPSARRAATTGMRAFPASYLEELESSPPVPAACDDAVATARRLLALGGASTAQARVLVLGPEAERIAEAVTATGRPAAIEAVAGDPRALGAEPEALDVVLAVGAVHWREPTDALDVLKWLHDRLVPGGLLLLEAPTVFSPAGGGLDGVPATPLAHLLFAPAALDAFRAQRGAPPRAPVCAFTAATWVTAFRRAGFEFDAVTRVPLDEAHRAALERFAGRFAFYEAGERTTSALEAVLRRPPRVDPASLVLLEEAGAPAPTAPGEAKARDFEAARTRWVTRDAKHTGAWGDEQADRLWRGLYARWDPVIDGRTILDLGCGWGYLLKFLDERHRPERLIGVDVIPYWDKIEHGWDLAAVEGLLLHEGDLLGVALEPGSVDTILCTSVFQSLTPEVLDRTLGRAFELLRPGGELLVRTQLYTAYLGANLHRFFAEPYIHLQHGEDLLRARVFEQRGRHTGYTNWLTASSYVAAFARAGFETREARRRMNRFAAETEARLARELPVAVEELNAGSLEARLLKPLEVEDLEPGGAPAAPVQR